MLKLKATVIGKMRIQNLKTNQIAASALKVTTAPKAPPTSILPPKKKSLVPTSLAPTVTPPVTLSFAPFLRNPSPPSSSLPPCKFQPFTTANTAIKTDLADLLRWVQSVTINAHSSTKYTFPGDGQLRLILICGVPIVVFVPGYDKTDCISWTRVSQSLCVKVTLLRILVSEVTSLSVTRESVALTGLPILVHFANANPWRSGCLPWHFHVKKVITNKSGNLSSSEVPGRRGIIFERGCAVRRWSVYDSTLIKFYSMRTEFLLNSSQCAMSWSPMRAN